MIDWDDAFDNTSYVDGADDLLETWAADALAFRQLHAFSTFAYGDDPREHADLFKPEKKPKGTVIFIHGGYWQMLDKSCVSHFAAGCLARGWQVIVPSYPLAPTTRVSDIVQSIARLVDKVATFSKEEIVLIGHSAGGHLVSRMACRDVPCAKISRVISVSGVHDLRPLCGTRMNDILGLTTDEATDQSPALCQPKQCPVTFWVGAAERPEFLRQNRLAGEAWPHAKEVYETGRNHFDIIESLKHSHGALTQEICGNET